MVHGMDEILPWTSFDAQSLQVAEGTHVLHALTNRILENGRRRSPLELNLLLIPPILNLLLLSSCLLLPPLCLSPSPLAISPP